MFQNELQAAHETVARGFLDGELGMSEKGSIGPPVAFHLALSDTPPFGSVGWLSGRRGIIGPFGWAVPFGGARVRELDADHLACAPKASWPSRLPRGRRLRGATSSASLGRRRSRSRRPAGARGGAHETILRPTGRPQSLPDASIDATESAEPASRPLRPEIDDLSAIQGAPPLEDAPAQGTDDGLAKEDSASRLASRRRGTDRAGGEIA